MKNKNIQIHSKKTVFMILAIIVLAAVVLVTFKVRTNPATKPVNNPSNVNLSPATAEEKQQAEAKKQAIIEQDKQNSPTTPAATKTVTPTIVDVGQYGDAIELRAFVGNIVESNGSCTVTFTKGSLAVTRTNAALADAAVTRCPNVSIPRTEFVEAGNWTVRVGYSSTTSAGESTSNLNIQ